MILVNSLTAKSCLSSAALNNNIDIVKYLVRRNLLKIVFGMIEDIYKNELTNKHHHFMVIYASSSATHTGKRLRSLPHSP